VLPEKITTVIFSIEKFRSKVLVKRELQFGHLQVPMHFGPKVLMHGASVFDSCISPREGRM